MKSMIIGHIYFLVLSSFFISLSFSYDCNARDREALLKIKEAFGNPIGLSSWNATNDCCHDFKDVGCSYPANRVSELTINDGILSGQIPPQVGDLTYLNKLYLGGINITGPIQPTIAKLKHLTKLTLCRMPLSGSIPSFLGQLQNLVDLDLSKNDLSGSIPSSLSELSNLISLDLSGNKLTGTIPNSFGTFKGASRTMEIYLSDNQLSGKIPASLGKMDFGVILLSRNKLEGDATMLFRSNKTFTLGLSENLLEFDLSKVNFSNDHFFALDLSHNKVYGNIPSQMTQLTNLLVLNVSYNRLCGQIPQGGKLQSFNKSSYFHNRCLCGSPLDTCK